MNLVTKKMKKDGETEEAVMAAGTLIDLFACEGHTEVSIDTDYEEELLNLLKNLISKQKEGITEKQIEAIKGISMSQKWYFPVER